MANSPNPDNRDRESNINYNNKRTDGGSSAGWWIAGVIAVVIVAGAVYQNHSRSSADNMSNIEPAAGSSVTTNTTIDDQNVQDQNLPTTNTVGPATNTTNP